jgi:mannose-6-phosphate isomerase-like protein (cupin superfamily)
VPLEMGGHGVREELLTPKTERHGQVIHTVMRAGGGSGGAYRLDATTIFVYVLRGELGITVDAHTTVLNTGGCLTFGATQLHDWRSPTDGEGRGVVDDRAADSCRGFQRGRPRRLTARGPNPEPGTL